MEDDPNLYDTNVREREVITGKDRIQLAPASQRYMIISKRRLILRNA